MNKVGILFSRMREEEKLIIESARKNGFKIEKVDSRKLILNGENNFQFDTIIDREISHVRSLSILQLMESVGIRTINNYDISNTCGDKVATTSLLNHHGIPNLEVKVAFSKESAIKGMESIGFPVVLKPIVGSWGRMLAKINDRDAAEAIIEHRQFMPGSQNSIFYIQEYVEKPGRDIRATFIGGETICAIYRSSEHWITNTARGAIVSNCTVTDEIRNLCKLTAEAIGGGILAIDIMETDRGLMINEVNHKMEFRNSIDVTGVDLPTHIIDYALNVGNSIL
tara:strand:- start:62534 stop:63379 length:846 start_codon:yes stop_codon:yes gene_type:complete